MSGLTTGSFSLWIPFDSGERDFIHSGGWLRSPVCMTLNGVVVHTNSDVNGVLVHIVEETRRIQFAVHTRGRKEPAYNSYKSNVR